MTARFLIKRLFAGALVMVMVTITVFFVTRLVTDPVRLMLPVHATQEQYDVLESALGLDRPLPEQFVEFLGDLATFNFGDSLWQRVPARDLVFDRLPASLFLVASGLAFAVLVFIPLGVLASLKPGSIVDRVVVTLSFVGLSMPQFWLGAILILFFAVHLGWLPTSGSGSTEHVVLPALALGLTVGARIAQITRSTMLDQVNAPYVSALRARGFGTFYILRKHVLRNALVPIVTVVMWEFGIGIAGDAIVIETVFAWPGLGLLIIQAIQRQDMILLQAAVFTAAMLVVAMNLIADIAARVIDPRIELH